jgi:hypothetical protein
MAPASNAQPGSQQPKEPEASGTLDRLPRVMVYEKGMIHAGTAALESTNNGKKSVTIDAPGRPRFYILRRSRRPIPPCRTSLYMAR